MTTLDRYLALAEAKARDGAARLTAHRLKYGYEPRWEMDPATLDVRILDCSLPMGRCPPQPPRRPVVNAIQQAIDAAKAER